MHITVWDLYKIIYVLIYLVCIPYIEIVLRMYLLYCGLSNCSAEWYINILKIIYSYLRSTVDDDSLAILNIESEITNYLKYEDIINEFVLQKTYYKI